MEDSDIEYKVRTIRRLLILSKSGLSQPLSPATTRFGNTPKYLQFPGTFIISLFLVATICLVPGPSTAVSLENQGCIDCHVQTFNQGIKNRVVHPPFFEAECRQCHLVNGAASQKTSRDRLSANGLFTGTVVNQGNLWRKLMTFDNQGGKRNDHSTFLPFLNPDKKYRFRIVVSLEAKAGATEEHKSLWLGLKPENFCGGQMPVSIEIFSGLTTSISAYVKSMNLSCPAPGTAIILSWKTSTPLFARVELQEMEGLDFSEMSSPQEQITASGALLHPKLLEPEEAAIDVCHTCHSVASLGASHPVRLYSSGTETRIPAELPTVNGMLTCVTCHDPHGGPGKKLIRETIKTKLCVACHYKFKNRSISTMFE